MNKLDPFTKALLLMCGIAMFFLMIGMLVKDSRDHDLKMAQAGLEQCKPHWMNNQIIWVKSCKEIINKL